MYADACGDTCYNLEGGYESWASPGIGRSLVFMAAQGCVCLFILYILESDFLRRVVRPFRGRQRMDNYNQGIDVRV